MAKKPFSMMVEENLRYRFKAMADEHRGAGGLQSVIKGLEGKGGGEMSQTYYEYYQTLLEREDANHPDFPNRCCWKCGERLVKGSFNYELGEHVDGCPTDY